MFNKTERLRNMFVSLFHLPSIPFIPLLNIMIQKKGVLTGTPFINKYRKRFLQATNMFGKF